MKTLPFEPGAYVVHAGFLGTEPIFACGDGTVWRGETPAPTRVHSGILAAAPGTDGKTLFTAGDDGRVCAIAATGDLSERAVWDRKWIDQLAVGPAGTLAFASGRQAKVLMPNGKDHLIEEPRAIGGLAFFPKGLRLALSTYNGVRLVYPGAAPTPQFLEWKGVHLGILFSADGRFLVTTMQEAALHGWKMPEGGHMRMSGYPQKVRSVSWSAKGKHLATSGANAAILWPFFHKDGPMGRAPLELGARQELVTAVACHPQEDIVAIGYSDGMILLVRIADGEEVLLRHPSDQPARRSPLSHMSWDAGGDRLAFGTEGGDAGILDLR